MLSFKHTIILHTKKILIIVLGRIPREIAATVKTRDFVYFNICLLGY